MKWILILVTFWCAIGQGARQLPPFTKLQEIAFDKTQNYEARWTALMDIVEHYPDGAETQMVLASAEPEWFMKNAALVGLEQLNSQRRFEIAKRLISDKALVVRSMSAQVLMKHNEPATRQLLWKELNRPHNFNKKKSLWIRHQIVEHLAKKPLKSERTQFIELFEEKDPKIKQASQSGLRRLQF